VEEQNSSNNQNPEINTTINPQTEPPATPPAPAAATSGEPKKKTKLWLLIIIAVLVVGGLVGVGFALMSGGHKNKTTTTSSSTAKPIKLVFAVHFLEDYQMNGVKVNGKVTSWGLNQYLAKYNATHPGIKVVAQQINYNDYANQLQTLYNSGIAPDIYQIYSPWGASYVKNGMLATPPAPVASDIQQNYVSTAGATIDGKVWGYPTEVDNYALLYNKTMFKQAGITDASGAPVAPKTWQDVVADAQKLTKKDAKGNITQYGIAFTEGDDWQVVDPFLSLLFSNNGSYLSSNYKQALFNSPAGVTALNDELQLFKNGSTDINGDFFDFGKSKVAMAISPPWPKSTFASNFGSQFSSTVGVAPFPYIVHPDTLQYSWFMGVMSSSLHQQAAWDFLKWLEADQQSSGTTRYGDFLAETIGAIPDRKVDFNNHKDVLGDFFTQTFVNQMQTSTAEPNVLQASQIKADLMAQIQQAWAGKETSQQALDAAAQQVNQILSSEYR
jgi:multiple sugar transport system substrate-binding protein